jgi:hypothetical protein
MQTLSTNVEVLTLGLKTGLARLMSVTGQDNSDSSNGVHFVNFNQDYT